MQQQSVPSRMQRRKARELAQALRPPRVLWRVLGTLPLLALGAILVAQSTLAWFTDRDILRPSLAAKSGTFETLMDVSAERIELEGKKGSSYSAQFTVTSIALVPLPIRAEWGGTGAGPNISLSASTIYPEPGHPNHTVTVTISGEYSTDFSGPLLIYIGSNDYDWGSVSVEVNAITKDIDDLIDVETFEVHCAGESGSWFDHWPVMKVTRKGSDSPTIKISVRQNPTTTDPVTVYDNKTNKGGKQITEIAPDRNTQDLYLHQDSVQKGKPTWVEVTLYVDSEWVTGKIVRTFWIRHCGDCESGRADCTPDPCECDDDDDCDCDDDDDECGLGHGDCDDDDECDHWPGGCRPGLGGPDGSKGDAGGELLTEGSQLGDGALSQDPTGDNTGSGENKTGGDVTGDQPQGDGLQGGEPPGGTGVGSGDSEGDEPHGGTGTDASGAAGGTTTGDGSTGTDSGDDSGGSGDTVLGGSGDGTGDGPQGGTGTDVGDATGNTAGGGDSVGTDEGADADATDPVKSWGVIP